MVINKEDYPEIYFLITTIIEELKNKGMNYQLSVKGLMLSLFMKMMRIYSDNSVTGENEKETHENAIVIAPALDYIKDNYMVNFPIEDLADMCHNEYEPAQLFEYYKNTPVMHSVKNNRRVDSFSFRAGRI